MTDNPHKLLDGVLVVSLEQAVAAPFASSRLADMGAEVIKIERPEGDFGRNYDSVVHGQSSYFVWLNRGKKSVVLDIKDPEDKALLLAILARADVFIQNMSVGAAERNGLGNAALEALNPRLITCDISGYGEEGPYAQRRGYDLLVQCETGLADITGSPEAPGRVGVSIADIATGMFAHAAILEALMLREKTGKGAHLKSSLFATMADIMAVPLLHYDYGGKAPQRMGLNHPSIAPYGAYASADGRPLMFSIQNEREWQRLCAQVLEQPDLATQDRFVSNDARVANRAALNAEIDAVFSSLPLEELEARMEAAKLAYARVNGVDGLSAHPQMTRSTIAVTPQAKADIPAPAVAWAGHEPQLGAVPSIGQHSAEIRARFGGKA